jgi:hypothetical protein
MPTTSPFEYQTKGSSLAPASAANRFRLDYRREAGVLGPPPTPIVDFHTHVNGKEASEIWREVAGLFGVRKALTMVRLPEAATVREVLGDMVDFIAFVNFRAEDKGHAFRQGFLDDIGVFHAEYGSRMMKIWNAPRLWEMFSGTEGADLVQMDSAWRVKQVELAASLGMGVMVHVADPDTWFATRYADESVFGRKIDHYRGFEVMLDRFDQVPWVAAHMGGWPENLDFLDGLLERHPNLSLDSSATKWVVRELSKHPRERVHKFFARWRGRLIFGSDIVTTDEHMRPKSGPVAHPMADLADSPAAAFDLYASRYLALRTMYETDYVGESPIADPDLLMVDPSLEGTLAAPTLRGLSLPAEELAGFYAGHAQQWAGRIGLSL